MDVKVDSEHDKYHVAMVNDGFIHIMYAMNP